MHFCWIGFKMKFSDNIDYKKMNILGIKFNFQETFLGSFISSYGKSSKSSFDRQLTHAPKK